MNCPNCGAPLKDDAKFCAACGSVVAEAPAEEAQGAEAVQKKESFLDKLPISPKTLIIAASAVVALILLIVIIVSVAGGGNYQTYDSRLFITSDDGTLYVVSQSGKVAKQDISGSLQNTVLSADGNKAVVYSSDGSLYYVTEGSIKQITDESSSSYAISVDGSAVIYIKKDGELYIYKGNDATKIASDVSKNYYCISPNGGAVGYCTTDEDGSYKGYVWDGKVNELGKNKVAIALSNGAGFVYYYRFGEDATATYVQKKFDDNTRQKLATSPRNIFLNLDHTEVYLYDGEKTVYSSKGGEKQNIFKYSVSFVAPSNVKSIAGKNSRTYGVSTFKNAFFYNSADERIVRLTSSLESVNVVKSGSNYKLANDGKTILFLRDNKVKRIDGSKTDIEATELAGSVTSFYPADDGNLFFYISDGEIFAQKGTGSATRVTDEASSNIRLYNGNTLLYVEDDSLYSSTGGKGKKVTTFDSDISAISSSVKLALVGTKDGAVYYSTNGTKFTKLYD